MKRNLNLERGIQAPDNISLNSESDNASCFPKRPSYYSRKQFAQLKKEAQAKNGLQKDTFSRLQIHPLPEVKNSPAFIKGQKSPRFNNRKKELIEVGNLEALIRRQKQEIDTLEDELAVYRVQWQTRLKDMKRMHREERRKLLRLMDHDDSIWNETKDSDSDMRDKISPSVKKTKFSNIAHAASTDEGAMPYDASAV